MVGIPGPSGGRFCSKTAMCAAAAIKSSKTRWKLLPLHLRLMISSPLRIAALAFDPALWGTSIENCRSYPKLCAKHTSSSLPRQPQFVLVHSEITNAAPKESHDDRDDHDKINC